MIKKRMYEQIREVRLLLALTVGLGLTGGLLVILEANFLAKIVNRAFLMHFGISSLRGLFAWLLIAILLRAAVGWASEVFAMRVALKVKADLRDRLIQHLFQLGPVFMNKERTGEVSSTVFEGIEALEVYLARYLPQVAISALVPLTILAFVIPNDWVTAVIFVFTWPLIPYFMMLIGRQAKRKSEKQFQILGYLSAHFLDVLQGISTLKLFNRSRYQLEVIKRIGEQYRKNTMDTLRIAFVSALALELLTTLSTAIVAVFIGLRVVSGQMQFQNAFFVLLLAPEFYMPIRLLGTQFHAGMNGVVAADRIFDILDTPPFGHANLAGVSEQLILRDWDKITFEQVSFQYQDAASPVISNLSFSIEKGEKIAIVGPSGAGKSTLMSLLLGFITPDHGEIRIGEEVLHVNGLVSWREQIAYLPQNPHLFDGTIADNLRLACPDCPLEKLKDAAARAGADSFIRDLPKGYETIVGENGARLSGGQIQRIVIARAFLKDSNILLLDEPTANLDPESEKFIQLALKELFIGKTVVVIAHRLSTIVHMDRILVLFNGHIMDQGAHQDLVMRPGMYHQLITAYTGRRGDLRV